MSDNVIGRPRPGLKDARQEAVGGVVEIAAVAAKAVVVEEDLVNMRQRRLRRLGGLGWRTTA